MLISILRPHEMGGPDPLVNVVPRDLGEELEAPASKKPRQFPSLFAPSETQLITNVSIVPKGRQLTGF